MLLTAAELFRASFGLRALQGVGVCNWRAVRAGKVRAECLTARSSGAAGIGAYFGGGALDRGETVGSGVRRT